MISFACCLYLEQFVSLIWLDLINERLAKIYWQFHFINLKVYDSVEVFYQIINNFIYELILNRRVRCVSFPFDTGYLEKKEISLLMETL